MNYNPTNISYNQNVGDYIEKGPPPPQRLPTTQQQTYTQQQNYTQQLQSRPAKILQKSPAYLIPNQQVVSEIVTTQNPLHRTPAPGDPIITQQSTGKTYTTLKYVQAAPQPAYVDMNAQVKVSQGQSRLNLIDKRGMRGVRLNAVEETHQEKPVYHERKGQVVVAGQATGPIITEVHGDQQFRDMNYNRTASRPVVSGIPAPRVTSGVQQGFGGFQSNGVTNFGRVASRPVMGVPPPRGVQNFGRTASIPVMSNMGGIPAPRNPTGTYNNWNPD